MALSGETPHRLTVVMPCLEYARQDRKLVAGEAIAPKLLLRCIRTAGATRLVTVDLHNQAEAAFSSLDGGNGGGMADILRVGFIMADRFRQKGGGRGDVKIISEGDLKAVTTVIVIDDMFDTCGNLVEVCAALRVTLPAARLYGDFNLQWLAVTNSVDQTAALRRLGAMDPQLPSRVKVIEISKLLAGAEPIAAVKGMAEEWMGAVGFLAVLHDASQQKCAPLETASPPGPRPSAPPDLKRRAAELRKRVSSA
eukprot:Skav234322  [mRNA]  locus=scaffold3847:80641:90653:- [translate_table: standard]